MLNIPFTGAPKLPTHRDNGKPWLWAALRQWHVWSRMPICSLWNESDGGYAMRALEVLAQWQEAGTAALCGEVRLMERVMGVTADARRSMRIRYVDSPGSQWGVPAGGRQPGAVPEPVSAEDTFPTAAEIAAMNDLQRKTLENRLRRRAARQGSKLERCTDAGDPAYGTYMVTSQRHRHLSAAERLRPHPPGRRDQTERVTSVPQLNENSSVDDGRTKWT